MIIASDSTAVIGAVGAVILAVNGTLTLYISKRQKDIKATADSNETRISEHEEQRQNWEALVKSLQQELRSSKDEVQRATEERIRYATQLSAFRTELLALKLSYWQYVPLELRETIQQDIEDLLKHLRHPNPETFRRELDGPHPDNQA